MSHSTYLTRRTVCKALGGLAAIGAATPSRAEPSEIKFALQYGLGHLPMMLLDQKGLLQKRLADAGLPNTKASFFQLAGSSAMNEALLSGSVDFTSGGLTGIAVLWAASRGQVKAAAAVSSMPMYLNTTNPDIRSLKDFGEGDKIGLPAVKVSPQAIFLQMAAEKELGDYAKLDSLTVTMRHPDAMMAMLSGSGVVNSHLTFPPYGRLELKDPKVRRILNSYDLLGGPTTIPVLAARQEFYDSNPKAYGAVVAALGDAIDFINKNPKEAAQAYAEISGEKKMTVDELLGIITAPDVRYSTTPYDSMRFVEFMHKRGALKALPSSWKDLYFPNVHDLPGAS